ncbi:PASTA domain-containing protein, partial [bacterium]|nr:PASTA domain-containing protein [bacterium]
VVREVVRPEVAALMRDIMTDVTISGTGRKAAVAEFAVAGKTGTAQKVVPGIRGYAPGKHVSSFAGFAPAEDPGVVILVVIDEPKGRGLGGEVAAPVFRRIVERVVRGTEHDLVLWKRNSTSRWSDVALVDRAPVIVPAAFAGSETVGGSGVVMAAAFAGAGASVVPAGSVGVDASTGAATSAAADDIEVTMPDLTGMSLRRARRTVSMLGLALSFDGAGLVRSQSPRSGVTLCPGDRVRVECR